MPTKPHHNQAELQRIWNSLLRLALYKRVPFQDAENLVSECLHKGLERFEETRGELLPFCRTILSNAVKNYWRDRKIDVPLGPDGDIPDDSGPDSFLEDQERIEAMNRKLQHLMKLLSPDELRFFKMLAQVFEELEDRAVSETARRLGLTPAAGWDINRKIQRKARSLGAARSEKVKPVPPAASREMEIVVATYELSEAPSAPGPSPEAMRSISCGILPVGDEVLLLAGALARQEAFERFLQTR